MGILGPDHDDQCEMYSEACGCDSRRELKSRINGMKTVKVEIDSYRQWPLELEDDDDDVIWLRLPDDVCCALIKLIGRMSTDDLMAIGISRDDAMKLFRLRHSVY